MKGTSHESWTGRSSSSSSWSSPGCPGRFGGHEVPQLEQVVAGDGVVGFELQGGEVAALRLLQLAVHVQHGAQVHVRRRLLHTVVGTVIAPEIARHCTGNYQSLHRKLPDTAPEITSHSTGNCQTLHRKLPVTASDIVRHCTGNYRS